MARHYGASSEKCVCGRHIAKDFICCRVCYEKLPAHIQDRLRFRGGHCNVSKQTYRVVQKAARSWLERNPVR